jgi:ABC-type lipoprotein export system ATPase subunit
MLEAIDLEKRFRKEILFQHFSFQLPNKGLILLTGPSGSGKTTLLQILQLNQNFKGRLRFDGVELSSLNLQQRNEFRRHFITSVHQEVELIDDATVEDHLRVMEHLKGHIQRPHVKIAIQQFLMEVSSNQTIRSLSRGQQQRFAILLACLGQTKMLLLDEPTTGLDKVNRIRIYQLLNIMKLDQLIVMSSHQAVGDGLNVDGHLALPYHEHSQIQIDKKKARLLPTFSKSIWPSIWYIRFHYRQRKFQPYRKRMHLSQTILFAIMGVMMSLIMLVGKEIIRITDTMIGGQYQYLSPLLKDQIVLKSTHQLDPIFSTLTLRHQLRTYYEENYFEYLKPYHAFYFDHQGFELALKDFHLGLINLVEKPHAMSPPFSTMELSDDDLVLGVQIHHLKTIAQTLNCFPTLHSINTVLSTTPLSVYFKIYVPDWQYRDESIFRLRKIELTNFPQWFHPSLDYAKKIYEDRLRLPTKGIEEAYDNQPWRVAKTMIINVDDDQAFLKSWQGFELWQHYHLQKHELLGWQVYKTSHPRNAFPRFKPDVHTYHYHSNLGYHYYPDQKLSGYAQPLFFHPVQDGNLYYLETLKQFEQPFAWLDVLPPPNTTIGYIFANPGTSMKLKTDSLYEDMALNEIMVSTGLIRLWNLKIGDKVYVDHGIFPQLNEQGRIEQTQQTSLKIIGTKEMDGNWLYHHPHWLSQWLMIEARIPSYLLEPEAWIFYQNVLTPIGYESINPLKEVQDSVQEIQQGLLMILTIWFLMVGIPLSILFFYYSIQSLNSDLKNLKALKGFGAPWSFIQHWYLMKFIVLGIEVVIPTLSVMMVLDYWLKRWLQQYFYLSISYQIPIEALLIFMLFVMVFYFTSTQINLKVIKTNFQNI